MNQLTKFELLVNRIKMNKSVVLKNDKSQDTIRTLKVKNIFSTHTQAKGLVQLPKSNLKIKKFSFIYISEAVKSNKIIQHSTIS